jgi:cytochrome c-type biogenesis protein CcmH/NrfG
MLGPALALAAVLERWSSKAVFAGAATILAALAVRSYVQVPYWQDEQTLFQHELAIDPYSLAGNTVLGTIAGRQGMTALAIDHALAAAHSVPDSLQKFLDVGRGLAARGRRDEAIDAYRQVLRLDPANAEASRALAALQSPATRPSR